VLLERAEPATRERLLTTLPGLGLPPAGRLPPRPAPPLGTLSSAGRAAYDDAEAAEEPEKAVDVFLWLKIMLRVYREEQAQGGACTL